LTFAPQAANATKSPPPTPDEATSHKEVAESTIQGRR
jgi:hypothetical protein